MERAGSSMAARAAADAAEVLAALCQFSGNSKRQLPTHSQDKRIAAQQFNDCATPTRITTSENIAEILPSQSRGKNCQKSKYVTKPRLKLTEDEKQERKVRRLLANREAARQTIRRRQAMFLELNNKMAHVSEENENLKKEKELAVKECHSLKDRNEFLKTQLANAQKAQSGYCMQEDPPTAEKSCSHPSLKHNHPTIVPCFCPHSIFPPLDAPKSLCAFHSSQFPMFLYPMHCLLPLYSYHGANKDGEENSHHCSMCSEARLREKDNRHLSKKRDMRAGSNKSMAAGSVRGLRLTFPSESGDNENTSRCGEGNISVPGLFSRVKPQESLGPARNDGSSHLIGTSNAEEMVDSFDATEARRRRKELMRLKGAAPSRHHAG